MTVLVENTLNYEKIESVSCEEIINLHKKFSLVATDQGNLIPLYSVYAEIEGKQDVLLFKCFDEKEYNICIKKLHVHFSHISQ